MNGEAGPEEEGQRLHPLGLFVGFITGLPQLIFPILAALFGTRGSNLGALPIIGGVLLVSLAFRWLGWRRFRYWIGADEVRIERGIINRTARSIPFERIADVGMEQKPLARMLGLAEIKFETGGGEGEDARLSFVSLDQAAALRETVRARKAGLAAIRPGEAEEPVEASAPVFAMDNRRLLTLGFYSFSLVIFAVLAGAAQQLDFLLPYDVWDIEHWLGAAEENGIDVTHLQRSTQVWGLVAALAGLVAIGMATGVVRAFLTDYGFRLDRTPKGFRRRRGLLTHTDVTLPVERVQAANIATGAIRVRSGWHALRFVSLASENRKEPDHMVAPLAQLDEIAPILAEVHLRLPDANLAFERAPRSAWLVRWMIVSALIVVAAAVAASQVGNLGWLVALAVLVPGLALWFAWRHSFHALDAEQIYARHGWWNRRLDLARQVMVQSVTLSRGPLDRWLGLARLDFGIAGGKLALSDVPLGEARQIAEEVMAIAAPVDFSMLGRKDAR